MSADPIEACQPYSDDGDLWRLWAPAFAAFAVCSPNYPAVEIGVRAGGSSMLLMHAIALTDKKRRLIAVDNYEAEIYTQFYPEAFINLTDKGNELQVDTHLFKLSSRRWILDQLGLGAYSFVYLDGSHEAEDVNYELDFFVPRIVAGGYLVVDNVNWPQAGGGTKWDACLAHRFQENEIHGVKLIHGF